MDFQSLRVFIGIAEAGSFSAAGKMLFLTQPAISKRVAALESELDCNLFDRIGRQIRLTEAGQSLLPRARRLLEDMQDIRRVLDQLSDTVSGTLAMGTSHHIGLHRLPPVLKGYSEAYPGVELDIRFLGSESVCHEVERGSLELGIVTLPPDPLPNLHMLPLWEDPLNIVVSSEHALAGQAADLQTLVQYPAVMPSAGTYTREILERVLREQDLELRVGMCTDYLETLKMLATTGLGWTLLPTKMLSAGLVSLDIRKVRLSRRLGIVTNRRHTLSNAARAMADSCRLDADAYQDQGHI